jgi:type IV pilus assembly protein PilB
MSDYVDILNAKLESLLRQQKIPCNAGELPQGRIVTDFLVEQGVISRGVANNLLSEACGTQSIDPGLISYDTSFIAHVTLLIPLETALKERVFAIKHEENLVHLVMANPFDEGVAARIEALTGSRLHRYSCCSEGIVEAIRNNYQGKTERLPREVDDAIDFTSRAISRIRNEDVENVWAVINNAHTINLLRLVMTRMVNSGASDIHFEPQKDTFRIRARLDGVLHVMWEMPRAVQYGIVPRLKMISGMVMEDDEAPQDGRIDYHLVPDREIDIRVSALPSIYGEKVVLRILDKGKNRLKMNDLSLAPDAFALLNEVIHRPSGLLLVTGPTGSGKTTTLYAFLSELNTPSVNISTAEDPVEYELPGITQVNCDNEKGLGFAAVLRSFLRQDPDIVMVGEIRDFETADIAVKASLTGHFVLSTLHTNDAASTVTRLVNIGVPPYLLSSCGVTILAQRLVRKICMECREEFSPPDETVRALGLENEEEVSFYRGRGCEKCSGTGYKGRMAVMEIMTVDSRLEKMILEQRPAGEMKKAAIENGMVTLREDALRVLRQGLTTPEEVLRVTLDT